MLGVDLTPALAILGVALALSVAVRIALAVGAVRARRRGAAILASVPTEIEAEQKDVGARASSQADGPSEPT